MISVSHWGMFAGRIVTVPKNDCEDHDVVRFRWPSELAEVVIVKDEDPADIVINARFPPE